MLSHNSVIGLVGLMVFMFAFKYSQGIFDWVENQTFGTRSYLLEKFELLFIEVKPDHVTYALLFLSVGLGVISICIVGILGSWVIGFFVGLFVAFIGFKIPKPVVDKLVQRRLAEYADQMVDSLTLLSNGIRAGLSVPQSLAMVVDEMKPPISQEFNLILQENKIGVPLEECFDNLAKRVPLEDNDMFVSGVNILRETGGNLAETFDTIVGVIRERIRLAQKIEQLTAQGMFQGYVIAAMPFGIGMIYYFTDPKTMSLMWTHPLGIVMLVVAVLLDLAGLIIIKKIVHIEA